MERFLARKETLQDVTICWDHNHICWVLVPPNFIPSSLSPLRWSEWKHQSEIMLQPNVYEHPNTRKDEGGKFCSRIKKKKKKVYFHYLMKELWWPVSDRVALTIRNQIIKQKVTTDRGAQHQSSNANSVCAALMLSSKHLREALWS